MLGDDIKSWLFIFLLLIFFQLNTQLAKAQQEAPAPAMPTQDGAQPSFAASGPTGEDEEIEKPNGPRIRRVLNLILGLDHDEEIKIPEKELVYRGNVEAFDIKRIKETDFFRISPKKVGNGIITIHNKKSGQILAEIRFDVRDNQIEKKLRELRSMLADIEGIEFKIAGGNIIIDGQALIPKDIIRISQVVNAMGGKEAGIRNIVSLSPLSRKKIAEYINRDINNPEVSVTAIGDYFKLEGMVNSKDEKERIKQIVALYMPDLVWENAPDTDTLKIVGRKSSGNIDGFIIDLLVIRPDDQKTEPAPKMIQIVAHLVEMNENYNKGFTFMFAPSFKDINGAVSQYGPAGYADYGANLITTMGNLVDRLIPKLNWMRNHGFARILDTASVLTQDKKKAEINRNITLTKAAGIVSQNQSEDKASVKLSVTPQIKEPRSGLIELSNLFVLVQDTSPAGNSNISVTTDVNTTISVRDRQSAAFGGIIKRKQVNDYGGPNRSDAFINLNQGKARTKSSSNFVVFVTPTIKSSASSGVDQVKKKFRLREN